MFSKIPWKHWDVLQAHYLLNHTSTTQEVGNFENMSEVVDNLVQEWDQIGFFIWQLRRECVCICVRSRALQGTMEKIEIFSELEIKMS